MSKHIAEQFTLLPEGDFHNAEANEIWKRREVDKLLDLYLEGSDLARIALKLNRNKKAIIRKLQEYIYNERNRTVNYQPKRRLSRKGKHLTKNEKQIIEVCQEKKVPVECVARVLMRSVSEFAAPSKFLSFKTSLPVLDLLLALRYIFHLHKKRIVSDEEYNALLEEEYEYGTGKGMLDSQVAASNVPNRINGLVDYLEKRAEDEPRIAAEKWKDDLTRKINRTKERR